jgi:WS/DGAT/MGAT family acyltransferase
VARPETELAFPRAMGAQDAMLWRVESDPRFRSTLMALTLLDRAPEPDRLRSKLERTGHALPRLRQRIEPMPELISTPLWLHAKHFDLDYHLRWVRAPGDGSFRAVLDLAAVLARQAFDPHRPPWEFVVVEGVAGEKAALIQKLHHSITDGVGGVMLMRHFFDLERDAPAVEPPRETQEPQPEEADRLQLGAEAIRQRLEAAPGELRRRAQQALSAARHPLEAWRRASEDLASLRRGMSSGPGPLSPIMQARSSNCRFDHFTLSLPALKQAAHAAGCKVNDAFLAGTTAGLRRYHEQHREPVEALNAAVPIDRRRTHQGSQVAGVDMAVARIPLPTRTGNPAERMKRLHELVASERDEPYQGYSELMAGLLYRLPLGLALRAYAATALKNDFVASCVPGFPTPLYLAGARIESLLAFGPLSGAAVNVTLFSYLDEANVTANVDTAAVPDLDLLVACLKEGFDEVLKLA